MNGLYVMQNKNDVIQRFLAGDPTLKIYDIESYGSASDYDFAIDGVVLNEKFNEGWTAKPELDPRYVSPEFKIRLDDIFGDFVFDEVAKKYDLKSQGWDTLFLMVKNHDCKDGMELISVLSKDDLIVKNVHVPMNTQRELRQYVIDLEKVRPVAELHITLITSTMRYSVRGLELKLPYSK